MLTSIETEIIRDAWMLRETETDASLWFTVWDDGLLEAHHLAELQILDRQWSSDVDDFAYRLSDPALVALESGPHAQWN